MRYSSGYWTRILLLYLVGLRSMLLVIAAAGYSEPLRLLNWNLPEEDEAYVAVT